MASELWQASAGTGKTHRLTEAYAEQVLVHGRHPQAVWAITFTERAAGELRARIVARLAEAAGRRPLGDPAGWPIGTFHTLALSARRRLAGGSPGPSAQRRVLGTGDDAAAMFVAAAQRAWWAGEAPQVEALRAVAPHLDLAALPEELWAALGQAREHGCQAAAGLWRRPCGGEVAAAWAAEMWTWSEALLAAADALTLTPRARERLAAFAAARPPAGMLGGGAQAADDTAVAAWVAAWRRALTAMDGRGPLAAVWSAGLRERRLARVEAQISEATWRRLQPALATLAETAWATYDADKAAAGVWDFTDLIAGLVARLQAHPGDQRRLAGDIAWVGVDEGQDTNPLQRRLLRLLVGLEGPAAGEVGGELWAVGDPKQAIYTFRGADPGAFSALGEDVAAKGGRARALTVSRRAAAPLVAALNHLSAHLLGDLDLPLEALPGAPAVPGWAGMWSRPVAAAAAAGPAGEVGLARASGADLEAAAVVALLGDLQRAGCPPSACAVLTATAQHTATFAAALRAAGIAYGMREGGLLFAQPAVIDTLACLHAVACPHARLADAIAMRSPAVGVGDAAITAELAGAGVPSVRDDDRRLAGWRRLRADLRVAAAHATVTEILEALDAALGLRALWAATPDGAMASAALAAVWRLAATFDREGGGGVLDFVHLQAARRARGSPVGLGPWQPEGAALTLATIHQSKGLEFDVVILPHLGFGRRLSGPKLRYCAVAGLVGAPRDAAGRATPSAGHLAASARAELEADQERRRLLYVAVTRARRAVVWVGAAAGPARGFRALLAGWWPRAVAEGVVRPWPPPPAAAKTAADTAATADTADTAAAPATPLPPPPAVPGPPAARRWTAAADLVVAHFRPPPPPPWSTGAAAAREAAAVWAAIFAALADAPPAAGRLQSWIAARLRDLDLGPPAARAAWLAGVARALAGPAAAPLWGLAGRPLPPPRWRRTWRASGVAITLVGEATVALAPLPGGPGVWARSVAGGALGAALAAWGGAGDHPATPLWVVEPLPRAAPAASWGLRLWRPGPRAQARAERLLAVYAAAAAT